MYFQLHLSLTVSLPLSLYLFSLPLALSVSFSSSLSVCLCLCFAFYFFYFSFNTPHPLSALISQFSSLYFHLHINTQNLHIALPGLQSCCCSVSVPFFSTTRNYKLLFERLSYCCCCVCFYFRFWHYNMTTQLFSIFPEDVLHF